MKKKLIGLLVVMTMLISYVSVIAHAEVTDSGTCGDNLTWTLDSGGTLTISGTGDMTDFKSNDDITWDSKKESVKSLIIEEGVTSITDYAFCYCDNLASVKIPQSISKIGEEAFSNCGNLSAIEVDKNNERYMSDNGILFNKEQTVIICYPPQKKDTSYTIPDSVTTIDWGAFSVCKNLVNIDIPDSVNSIGGYAFEECSNLTSLTIPDGVTTIEYGMAINCEKLASIKFPDSIKFIASYVIDGTAYYDDPSSWTDGVLYVNNCLMEAKRSEPLGNYQIKDGTLTIGDDAFYTCEGLTGISIPSSVTSIGHDAFEDTAFYNDNSNWSDNALYIDNCLVETKKALSGNYQIKDGTRLIACYAFSDAGDITSITIPKSVTSIGEKALYIHNKEINLIFQSPAAVKLHEYVLGDTINKINIHKGYTGYTSENGYPEDKITVEPHSYENGICTICGAKSSVKSGTCGENLTWTLDDSDTLTISGTGAMSDFYFNNTYAPWYDSRLDITNVIIEDGVANIGMRAFMGCENLKTISIPPSVTKSDWHAFDKCTALTGVYITDLAAWCSIEFSDYDRNPLYYAKNLYINGELAENITIPDGVEKISNYAFYTCHSITNVNMPDSVKEIGKYAFAGCTNLQNEGISNSVETIDEGAFLGCTGLTSIYIPEGVKSIGSRALRNSNLSAVEVDENNACYMAEDGILFDKEQTKIVLYPRQKSGISYSIPESVKSIAEYAFSSCNQLESVDIPDGVRHIGASAFAYCTNLTGLVIPDSVNYIGTYAFRKCVNLTSLTIPESVNVINYGIVQDCEKLASVNIPESVKSISWNVFDGTAYYNDSSNWTDGVLYIDNCLVDAQHSLSGDYKIKDGTRVIASLALLGCDSVTGISIPESVTNIGSHAFEGTAYYEDKTNWDNGVLYIDNCLINIEDNMSGEFHVKDGTRIIAEDAFLSSYNTLTSITIPISVTNINNDAFDSCKKTADFIFEAPNAPVLGSDRHIFPDTDFKIHIHEGYTGYTAENGYPEDKIVVEPHSYENGVCTVCGAEETVPPAPLITKTDTGFTVQPDKKHENCTVYTAVYNTDGRLLRLACEPVKAGAPTDIAIDFNGGTSAKVFIWADNFEPVLKTAEPFEL